MGLDTTTAITLGSGHTVWDEGTKEHFGRGGNSGAVRRIRCAWADRLAIASYLMGGSSEVGGAHLIVSGQSYPDYTAWHVQDVDIEGDGLLSEGAAGMVAYVWAILTVKYAVPKFEPGNVNLIGTEELDFASHAIALMNEDSVFEWTSGANSGDDVPTSAIPAVTFTTVSFDKVRYRVPALPEVLIESLIDKTNNVTMFGATAGTLLFRGARSFREITAAGAQNWTVAYRFEYSRNGWNKLPDGANGWQTFAYKVDGSLLFPQADLSALFA
jgi:hypothetical protein